MNTPLCMILKASYLINHVEKLGWEFSRKTKQKFGSPELQALEKNWITIEHLRKLGNQLPNSDYGTYLANYSK